MGVPRFDSSQSANSCNRRVAAKMWTTYDGAIAVIAGGKYGAHEYFGLA